MVERVALSLSLYAVEFLAPTALALAFLRSELRRRYRDGVRAPAAFGPDGIPVPPAFWRATLASGGVAAAVMWAAVPIAGAPGNALKRFALLVAFGALAGFADAVRRKRNLRELFARPHPRMRRRLEFTRRGIYFIVLTLGVGFAAVNISLAGRSFAASMLSGALA